MMLAGLGVAVPPVPPAPPPGWVAAASAPGSQCDVTNPQACPPGYTPYEYTAWQTYQQNPAQYQSMASQANAQMAANPQLAAYYQQLTTPGTPGNTPAALNPINNVNTLPPTGQPTTPTNPFAVGGFCAPGASQMLCLAGLGGAAVLVVMLLMRSGS
jgi:hypothetical protein